MKRVQLKLLLCILLVISTTTGQYNNAGSWALNYGGQSYVGQPNVMNWANYPGYGSYGGYASQPTITPQYGAAFMPPLVVPKAVSQTNAQQSIVEATTSVPSSINNLEEQSAIVTSVTVDGNPSFKGDCYNIIDDAYPMFSAYCSVLPQTTFSLPNFFGHKTKKEANNLLTSFKPALYSGCFAYMRMFLCPLFFPSCTNEPVLPCASLCRAVQSRCGSVDLAAIDCNKLPEKSEFCSTIVVTQFLTADSSKNQRTEFNSKQGKKINYSNEYSETSSTSGSTSSFDSSHNQGGQSQANIAGYKGIGSATGTYLVNVKPAEVPRVTPSVPSTSDVNSGATIHQIWNVPHSSAGSLNNIEYSRLPSNVIKPISSSYGLTGATVEQGKSSSGDSFSLSSDTSNGNIHSLSYGINNNYNSGSLSSNSRVPSGSFLNVNSGYEDGASFSSNNNYGSESSSKSDGTNHLTESTSNSNESSRNSYGSVDSSSSYINNNNNNNNADRSSYGNTVNSIGSASFTGGSSTGSSGSSLNSETNKNDESAFLNLVRIHDSGSLINNNKNDDVSSSSYDDEYYSNDAYGTVGSLSSTGINENRSSGSSAGSNENRGSGSSYGNIVPSVGSTSYSNNNNNNNVGSNLISSSSSSSDNSMKTIKGILSGTNKYYGGEISASGSSINNAGLASHGSSGSYGASSYNKNAGYSGPGSVVLSRLPFGLQTVSEFINYVPEKLDLSKCGPKPTKNPCTINGPQHYEISGYPNCYIHCSFGQMFVKPCPPELVWNNLISNCDWPTTVDYLADENNAASSSYSTSTNSYRSSSSLSNGRKKRSTTERKKRFRTILSPSLIRLTAPISPPSSSFVPLPGFSGAIGIPGPLVPQPNSQPAPQTQIPMFPMDTARFLPQGTVNVAPQPSLILPKLTAPSTLTAQPQMLTPIFPQPQVPTKPKPPQLVMQQQTFPQLLMPQQTLPQLYFPQPQVPQMPIQRSFEVPQQQPQVPMAPPSAALPPFIPPIFPTLPIPLDGPLLPPLPMTIPATYIPGPPPIFGAPWFGPFSEASAPSSGSSNTNAAAATSPLATNPFLQHLLRSTMGYGGGLSAGSNFYGGFPQQFQGFNPYYFLNMGSPREDNSENENEAEDSENSGSSKNDNDSESNGSLDSESNPEEYYAANYRLKRQYEPNEEEDTSILPTNGQQGLLESPCIGKAMKSNIPHPIDSTKYIACLNDNKYEIMDCPSGFIYNSAIDQCEKPKKIESVCERERPCLNNGQCYSTSSTTYKCVCQGLWAGERCEIPLSPCATNPCGEGNQCRALVTSDYKQDYVCICNNQQSYGLTCSQNTKPNPCIGGSNDQQQYYPFEFSVHAYVQCDDDLFHVRPCAAGLVWNQQTQICDYPSQIRPLDDLAQFNPINYNLQSSATIYDQLFDNFVDESADENQVYPYQYYNPYTASNDENIRSNQMYIPDETSIIHSYFSLPSVSKSSRHTKNQKEFDSQRNLLRLLQSSKSQLEK